MPVVRNTARDPAATAIPRALVRVRLVAGTNLATPGYTSDGTIIGVTTSRASAAGLWQVTLPANTTITPTGTYYEVVETDPVLGVEYISYATVPNGAGPYQLSAILNTTSTPPSGLWVAQSQLGAAGGIATLDASSLVPVAQLPAATTLARGAVRLAGDLGGTADAPTTPTKVSKAGDSMTGNLAMGAGANIGVGGTSYGGGLGVVAIAEASTAPTGPAPTGGVAYVKDGALCYRCPTTGLDTVIAPG